MKIRKSCEFSAYGLETFKKQRKGLVVGESRDKQCWWVKWNGNKLPSSYAKEFISFKQQPTMKTNHTKDGSELSNTEPTTTSSAHQDEQSEVRGIEDWEREFDEKVSYDDAETGCEWEQDDIKKSVRQLFTHLQEQHEREKRELVGALEDMYNQYCHDGHSFMSAGEHASYIIKKYGTLRLDEVGRIIN